MYFPYLRGRQFELIALRELLESNILSRNIIPIIEPVKLSSTLIKTIATYSKMERQLGLITNSKVGNFKADIRDKKNEKLLESFKNVLNSNKNIIYTRILVQDSRVEEFLDKYSDNMMTICFNKDAISIYEEKFIDLDVKYNLIPDESGFRRKIRKNRVILENKFNKQERNNDYIDVDDEPFSEDHLYYLEDGYIGFADYSVVGKDYSDTGFIEKIG